MTYDLNREELVARRHDWCDLQWNRLMKLMTDERNVEAAKRMRAIDAGDIEFAAFLRVKLEGLRDLVRQSAAASADTGREPVPQPVNAQTAPLPVRQVV
jgi:hypothetical protein